MFWLDAYERRARFAPGLLALLPVAITVVALGLRSDPLASVILSAVSLAGGPMFLASVVRHGGREAQRRLWDSWDGSPTTRALRLREPTANNLQREQWRKAVEQVTQVHLATSRSERANPPKADEAIEVAVGRLRELTRDEEKFPLVIAENKNYGFQRNLFGIRQASRSIAVGGIIVIVATMAWRALANHLGPVVLTTYALGLALNVIILVGWFALISEKRVYDAADRYAYQLLQAAVTLASDRDRRSGGAV